MGNNGNRAPYRPRLDPSAGDLVYQVMLICEIKGVSLGQRDIIQRAINEYCNRIITKYNKRYPVKAQSINK